MGGQSIPAFDYDMAPGVLKTYISKYKENAGKAIERTRIFTEDIIDDVIKDITDNIQGLTSIEMVDHYAVIHSIFKGLSNAIKDASLDNHIYNVAKDVDEFAHKYAYKETDRATYQAMEGIVHNLNTMHSRAGAQVPFSSLNLGTNISPEGRMVTKNFLLATEAGLGNGEIAVFPISIFKVKEGVNYNPEDPNYDLLKLAMRVSSKRLFPNFSFLDAPFNLKYYDKNNYHTECTYMGCRTKTMANRHGKEIVTGRGNISFTTINLPRLGLKFGKALNDGVDYDGLFNALDDMCDLAIEQLVERYRFQAKKKVKNFPFLMGQGVWMGSDKLNPEDTLEDVIKHGSLSVGFIGLAECLVALIGKHHGESKEAAELGIKIISFMKEKCVNASNIYDLNFALLATPAEGLSGGFIGADREAFGIIKGINDREYYTNSFHVPVYYPISAFDKIDIEAPYHALCDGGHISYVELDGDASNNLEAFEAIIRHMKETGVGYGSINHPVDRCPKCGYNGIIGYTCPNCNITEEEVRFERTRRITGYLVGTMDRWNNAKFAEEADRVKHNVKLSNTDFSIEGNRANFVIENYEDK